VDLPTPVPTPGTCDDMATAPDNLDAGAAAVAAAVPEATGVSGSLVNSQLEGSVGDRTSAGTGTERKATPPHLAEPSAETNPSRTAQEPPSSEQEDIKPDIRGLDPQPATTSTCVAAEQPKQQRQPPKRSRLDEELGPEEKKLKTPRLMSCETEESDMEGIEDETGVAASREQSEGQSETGKSTGEGEGVFSPFGVPIGFHLCLDDAHATAMELLITVSGSLRLSLFISQRASQSTTTTTLHYCVQGLKRHHADPAATGWRLHRSAP
jgi:hypothetical protein